MLTDRNRAEDLQRLRFSHLQGVYLANQPGRWQQTAEPERSISGVIQPADERALSLLPEGDRSGGALLIHTHARLSWYDVEQGATSNRQTLVRYDDSLWRVVKSARLAGIWRYLAIRYVNNDPDHP